jgi:xanthine dehydrogenase small subunit
MATPHRSLAPPESVVRFVLDDELIELENPDPTRTVLQFLREDLRRTGTKEGCAEGDCGACTVVVGTPDGDGLRLQAVNACIQFLPALDGTVLFTVESLADGPSLHPVQQAMVDAHASQCGFCTPGFVMSLFALYKDPAYNATDRPGRRDIDDALAGNLCRCTGYRPIVAAAADMFDRAPVGGDWLRSPGNDMSLPAGSRALLHAAKRERALDIRHGTRRFTAPTGIEELAAAFAERPEATLLAGGTDIGLWVTKQHRSLDDIIHVGRVRELRRLRVTDGQLEIGAAVSLTDAVPAIVASYPDLAEMFTRFASPPIRNAGTLGGNIANGSPIGDSMPALMVLGTTLLLRSSGGQRELALDEFYVDYGVTALEAGEFVEALRIPLPDDEPEAETLLRCYKVSKRFDQDISAICGAFRVSLDGATVREARIAFGGMAATVRRARHCEAALEGRSWERATIDGAAAALSRDFAPISDMRASAGYRQRVAGNLLHRLLLDAGAAAPTNVYSYGRAG